MKRCPGGQQLPGVVALSPGVPTARVPGSLCADPPRPWLLLLLLHCKVHLKIQMWLLNPSGVFTSVILSSLK